jgi:hypothetical protein
MKEAIKEVPRAPKEIKLTPSDKVRFWAKVNKDGPTMPHMETPCWIWTAGKHKSGYGQMVVGGATLKSHRIMWSIAKGSAGDLCVMHLCDNPACCRIDHLQLGTHADNAADRERKGRGNQPRGDAHGSRTKPWRRPRGDNHYARIHPERLARGESNGSAKLTANTVERIRARYTAGGITHKQIAGHFGVNRSTIGKIIRREIWNLDNLNSIKL